MKEKEKLIKILNALNRTANDLAADCAYAILNQNILFLPGFESEKLNLYNIYKIRLYIAQNLHRDKFTEEDLKYWEKALLDIENKEINTLVLSIITADNYAYLIFLTKDLEEVVSIIRLTSNKTIEEYERTRSTVKFSKGELVKNWKESDA
uniref:Uncharacterized protein n=1 Tax=Roseihalotalea indica TaxID=2867963 RepID=A0AA49GIA8_9BACT|nr:hypothetical protein K4G66_18845 [Tunicatimonas sp. TK19036]